MSALWTLTAMILSRQRRWLLRGAALGLAVLVAGAALLGLSGWFITAAAAAGLAGAGAVFDVFRPAAMVRFLALGRTVARYGERLLTHDATLRALEALRLRLLAGQLAASWERIIRLRGPEALNRLTADVEALDGVPLRLALPLAAGLVAQLMAFAVLWWLAGLVPALWILLGWLGAAALVFALSARAAVPLSRRAGLAAQAFRARTVDLVRARPDLAVFGRLAFQAGAVARAEARRLVLRRRLDRIERAAGFGLGLAHALIGAGALGIGMWMSAAGSLDPARAAMVFFVAIALFETVQPLRRALSELGRMADAARRVLAGLEPREVEAPLSGQAVAAPDAGAFFAPVSGPVSGPVSAPLSVPVPTPPPGQVPATASPRAFNREIWPDSRPGSLPDSRLESGSASGLGSGPVPALGPSSVAAPVSGSGTAPGPGQGSGYGPGHGPGRTPASAPGARACPGPSPAPGSAVLLAVGGLELARPGGGRPVLSGLSFTLRQGETLALTGPSGCGKSTLLLALAGMVLPGAGQITLAGRPLQDIPEPALRRLLTLLPQRSALMAGSVAEALRLADPGASDTQLGEVLEAVGLSRMLAARAGLATMIGPRGEGLSGGEGRRLALARALLRRPALLLLDEPTEGLDAKMAGAVLRGVRQLLPQVAILMASHRAAETEFATRILDLGQFARASQSRIAAR